MRDSKYAMEMIDILSSQQLSRLSCFPGTIRMMMLCEAKVSRIHFIDIIK